MSSDDPAGVSETAPALPFASFDEAYQATPPWEIGRPQPALAELFDAGEVSGSVLDAGCGTGELTMLAASRGLHAVGVDSSPRAIAMARERAATRGIAGAGFEVGDALDLSFLHAAYDTVLDSGVLHVFDDADRVRYVESISRVLNGGGRYHLLVFSDAQPGTWGPRRIRRAELEAIFAVGWELLRVEPAEFELVQGSAHAWRATAVYKG
ncbi:MAG TPA: class I SAM-dependent methyltransferase [Candidatus Dormibacteraeota bacterium]